MSFGMYPQSCPDPIAGLHLFEAEHGGPKMPMDGQPGHYWFEDGAVAILRPMLAAQFFTPTSAEMRLRHRAEYYRVRSRWLRRLFDVAKAAAVGSTRGELFTWHRHAGLVTLLGPSSGNVATDLTRLRAAVHSDEQTLAELERQLDDLPEARAKREAERYEREWRAASAAAEARRREEVEAINL